MKSAQLIAILVSTCLTTSGCQKQSAPVTISRRTVVQKPVVEREPINDPNADAGFGTAFSPAESIASSKVETPTDVSSKGGPVAVIENHLHEFGNMEPHQQRQHTFIIRNDGDAPLEIRAGESSCKCTIGEVGTKRIEPGGRSTILLTWRTTTETKLFAHEAEVLTNDPNNPVLVCRVQGTVLQLALFAPSSFSFSGVTPGTAPSMSVTITSELWNRFSIKDIDHKMNLETRVTPLTDAEKATLDVKDGHRLTVALPEGMERGSFTDVIRFRLVPEGDLEAIYEIPVSGRVLRRVSVYGKGIDSFGRMKLGRVPEGRGIKKYFAVKVRDPQKELRVKELKTVPEFLQVSFDEMDVNVPGMYRMLVEVPPSAPPSFFTAGQGQLHVEFENPRFEDLDLSVEFAVGNDT